MADCIGADFAEQPSSNTPSVRIQEQVTLCAELKNRIHGVREQNVKNQETLLSLKCDAQACNQKLQAIRLLHAQGTYQIHRLQDEIDEKQRYSAECMLWLYGFLGHRQKKPCQILSPCIRDRAIRRLKQRFCQIEGYGLESVIVSHHFPSKNASSKQRLSPKTLLIFKAKEDAKAFLRVVRKYPMLLKDACDDYISGSLRCERYLGTVESRLRVPVDIIEDCLKCYLWQAGSSTSKGWGYTWEQADYNFRCKYEKQQADRCIKKKSDLQAVVRVEFEQESIPKIAACYVTDYVFQAIKMFWEQNIHDHLAYVYGPSKPKFEEVPNTRACISAPVPQMRSTEITIANMEKNDIRLPNPNCFYVVTGAGASTENRQLLGYYMHAKYRYHFHFLRMEPAQENNTKQSPRKNIVSSTRQAKRFRD